MTITPPPLWPTSRARAIAVSAVVGIAYAAVIAVGRVVATTSFASALFNPAIGVAAIGALWCLRRGWAPSWLLVLGVVGGEWLGWLGGAPVGGTLLMSVAHGLEVLVVVEAVVWLIQRMQLQTPEPRALVVTVGPAFAGATVAIAVVLASAKALGYQPDLWTLAGHTWLSDFLGVLVVLPVFLTMN